MELDFLGLLLPAELRSYFLLNCDCMDLGASDGPFAELLRILEDVFLGSAMGATGNLRGSGLNAAGLSYRPAFNDQKHAAITGQGKNGHLQLAVECLNLRHSGQASLLSGCVHQRGLTPLNSPKQKSEIKHPLHLIRTCFRRSAQVSCERLLRNFHCPVCLHYARSRE